MVNTRGFQTVAEITEASLLSIIKEAWRSGSLSNTGTMSQAIQIPAGTALGPYTLADGTVQIPQEQIRLDLNPGINGFNITLGLLVDLEIANPPVPSAQLFNLTADVTLRVPVGNAPDPLSPVNLAVLLENLPANAVDVVITSGDPFANVLLNGPEEYMHQLYQDNTIPHLVEDLPLNFGQFSMKASVQFFDDEADASKRITVSYPPNQLQVNLPCYLRFYDITDTIPGFSLASPMGVFATARLTMPFSRTASHIHIGTDNITVDLVNITPGPGAEGVNYNINKALVDTARLVLPALPTLEDAIRTGFVTAANTFFAGRPPVDFDIPTLSQLEDRVEQLIRDEMNIRRWLILWAPEGEIAEGLTIADITPKVLTDVLAIAFNGGPGANANLLDNFVPASSDFSIALDDDFIEGIFVEKLDEQFPSLPVTLPEDQSDGHNIRLESLGLNLVDGAIRVTGSLTLVDEILGSIDVGVNFTVNLGLRWKDNPDGTQMLEPFIIGDPDVDIDLDILGWILAFLTGFVLLGLIGGIIFLIILAIVIEIVESVGGGLAKDALGNVTGIAAWPVSLPHIGNISARFKNPVDIFATGVRFIGEMDIISSSSAALDSADSNGPYSAAASALIAFNGGSDLAVSQPQWLFGDGNSAVSRRPNHRYGDSGQYVAKLRIHVNETGGTITRNFTAVRLQNVPPTVSLPNELKVLEGQEVDVTGKFTDPEWLDQHQAIFDWGDNSKPTVAVVSETNTAPEGQGTATARHAWCDNGTYFVRLTVMDDDGGVGEATMKVIVENVAPIVHAPEKLCTLVGQPIVMNAVFEDAGWCDEHTAEWDFGDCQIKNAFVEETHNPPKGEGTVSVCHEWANCGIFQTQVTVTDDDGGVGTATTMVHAVSLKNANFEQGFRLPHSGLPGDANRVANNWHPYAEPVLTLEKEAVNQQREWLFFAEQMVERESRRAQGIRFRGAMQAGIYQQICANPGWDYEFSAHYHLVTTRSMGKARIGIDPMGGTAPGSAAIIWRELPDEARWNNITVRATALAEEITVFFGGIDRLGGQDEIYLDQATLCQIQPHCPKETEEPPCKETCVDFNDLDIQQHFPPGTPSLLHHNIQFTSAAEMYIVGIATPLPAHHGLFFTPRGIMVQLPEKVTEAKVTIRSFEGGPEFKVELRDGGTPVSNMGLSLPPGTENEFTFSAGSFDGFLLRGTGIELALIKICYCKKTDRTTRKSGVAKCSCGH